MTRMAPRLDANQPDIVEALRVSGATVFSLAGVANGCPDLLVGLCGRTFLIEVKDGAKPPSKRALTTDQEGWFAAWRGGPVTVLTSATEALAWVKKERPR